MNGRKGLPIDRELGRPVDEATFQGRQQPGTELERVADDEPSVGQAQHPARPPEKRIEGAEGRI